MHIIKHLTFQSLELFTSTLHLLIDSYNNVPIVDLFYSSFAEI